ncbi:MAG: hypothetical protein WD688_18240 [Candidatus Binatia bacterium]
MGAILYRETFESQRGFIFLALIRQLMFQWSMRLITAHRILIATSVVFFFGFSFWQFSRYLESGDGWALLQGSGYFLVALGFGIYFMRIKKRYG